MAQLTNKSPQDVFIQDLLAVDVAVPYQCKGYLAGEFSMEQAVGIASMVRIRSSTNGNHCKAGRKRVRRTS